MIPAGRGCALLDRFPMNWNSTALLTSMMKLTTMAGRMEDMTMQAIMETSFFRHSLPCDSHHAWLPDGCEE